MPTPKCTQCGKVIPSADINVANDVAYCRSCNLSHALSDLTHSSATASKATASSADLSHPPSGITCHHAGQQQTIRINHRSLGTALGALFIALFWNGIVSVFVLLAIAGTLNNLGISQPEWFPAPKMNGQTMSVGMNLFLWLFLSPFIAIGLAMIYALLSSLIGRTEITIGLSEVTVFTGLGPVGWRRRCPLSAIQDIRIAATNWQNRNQRNTQIVVETSSGKEIKFGSGLDERRQDYLVEAMRSLVFAPAPPVRRGALSGQR